MLLFRPLRLLPISLLLGGVLTASSCHAQEGLTTSTWAGCQVQARAYVDPMVWESSRFDMAVVNPPNSPTRWDFTLDWEHFTDPQRYTAVNSQSRLPYGKAKTTTIHATLCQYAILEERVTFHDLDLNPLADDWDTKHGETPRFLALPSAVTATTPSGIRITLPAQNVQHFTDMFSGFNGPIDALFIRIETMPNQPETILSLSPLYRKYYKPVLIQINNADNLYHYSNADADNTATIMGINLPNLRTVMHLNALTLIVRQRVNLKEVPVAVRVPISRPASGQKA